MSVLLKPGQLSLNRPALEESLLTELRGKEEEAKLRAVFLFHRRTYLEDHLMTWIRGFTSMSSKSSKDRVRFVLNGLEKPP